MAVTDRVKRFGIDGVGYPVGPANLKRPLADDTPSELSRLSGISAFSDRWEVKTGSGPGAPAGDYTISVGPYSERGLTSTHRALGDVAVFKQAGGVANSLAPISCLGRKRPGSSRSGVALGPITVEEGDRLWVIVECKDYSTLKYQIELDFTAAAAPGGDPLAGVAEGTIVPVLSLSEPYFLARIQDQTLVTYNQVDPYWPYGYEPNGTLASSTAIGPNDEMYIGGTYQNEAMVGLPTTEPSRTPWVLRLGTDGEVAWKVHLESLGPVLPAGYTITSVGGASNSYGQEVTAMAVDPVSGDLFALLSSYCSYVRPSTVVRNHQAFTVVVRISSAGVILAQKLITTANDDDFPYFESNQICCDGVGNVYILGRFSDTGIGPAARHPIILKYDNSLSPLWKRAIQSSVMGINDLAVTQDGVVYFAGRETFVGNIVKTNLMKFASDGTPQWQKILDKIGAVATTQQLPVINAHPDGGVVLYERLQVGTPNVSVDEVDVLLRIDATGAILWQKRSTIVGQSLYGGSTAMVKKGMTVGSDGTIYAASVRGDTPPQELLSAYSGNGNFLFSNAYGADDGWDGNESMFQLPAGFGGIGTWDNTISAGSNRVIWNMCMFQAGYLDPPVGSPYRFYQAGVFVLPNDAAVSTGLYDMNYTPVNPGTGAYLEVTESNVNYFTASDGDYVLGISNAASTTYTPGQPVTCVTTAIYVPATLARPFETSALTYFPEDLLTTGPFGSIGWVTTDDTDGYSTHIDTSSFRTCHVQTIYKASEILASGLVAGSVLNGLTWYVIQPVEPYGSILGFKVRLFHTASVSAIDNTPAVPIGVESKLTVYSDGPLVEFTAAEVAGELTVNFSSNFTWNGTSNICVETCMMQNQDTWTYPAKLRCTYPVGENGTLHAGDDEALDGCALTPDTALPPRASIKFSTLS